MKVSKDNLCSLCPFYRVAINENITDPESSGNKHLCREEIQETSIDMVRVFPEGQNSKKKTQTGHITHRDLAHTRRFGSPRVSTSSMYPEKVCRAVRTVADAIKK